MTLRNANKRVEIKPYYQYKRAVYVNGEPLPAQLIQDPRVKNGVISVRCYSSDIKKPAIPSQIPHWHRIDIEPKTTESPEITTFYFYR